MISGITANFFCEVKVVNEAVNNGDQTKLNETALGNIAKSQKSQAGQQKKCYSQTILRGWCKECGICVAFCPKNVIGRNINGAPVIEHPENCNNCKMCELLCPDFAIIVQEIENDNERGARYAFVGTE